MTDHNDTNPAIDTPYRIGVISDTHGFLSPQVFEIFAGVDLILHSGDVENDDILAELETIAPVQAVGGNVDYPPNPKMRPDERVVVTPIGKIAMTHGHLENAPTTDREQMVKHFAAHEPIAVIYGHTHKAKLELINGVSVFNPGAAGRPRLGASPSVGMIVTKPGGVPQFEHHGLTYPPQKSQ